MSVCMDPVTNQYRSMGCWPYPPAPPVPPVPPQPVVISAADLIYPDEANGLTVKHKKLMCLIVSRQDGNYLRYGNDRGAFLDGNDILSNGDDNLLRIDASDGKIKLTTEAVKAAVGSVTPGGGSVTPSELISTNANNALRLGTDSKLYVAPGSAEPSTLISTASGNALQLGADGKLYVSQSSGGGSAVDPATGNLIQAGASGGAFLPADVVWAAVRPDVEAAIAGGGADPSSLISADANNGIITGSDGKLFFSLDAGEL